MRAITARRSFTGIFAAAAVFTVALAAPSVPGRQTGAPAIADFFRDYAAEWVRIDPDRARATRYFTGAEQDRLERQLTPHTSAFRHARVTLARRGLARLRQFNRAPLTESERLSADIMQWQLQAIADG